MGLVGWGRVSTPSSGDDAPQPPVTVGPAEPVDASHDAPPWAGAPPESVRDEPVLGEPVLGPPVPAEPGPGTSLQGEPVEPPERAVPAAVLPLRGDDGADWQPVSPSLTTARSISLAISMLPIVAGLVLASVLLWSWLWWAVAGAVALWVWSQWVVLRQVSAISWAELPDELAIRQGRILRTLTTVPYGRIQYVDVNSGPLLRRLGLASLSVHTAHPGESADLPGLPEAEATRLRARLADRGEAQRVGL